MQVIEGVEYVCKHGFRARAVKVQGYLGSGRRKPWSCGAVEMPLNIRDASGCRGVRLLHKLGVELHRHSPSSRVLHGG